MSYKFSISMILLSIFVLSCKSIRSNTVPEENSTEVASIPLQSDTNFCDSILDLFPISENEYIKFYDLTKNNSTNDIFLNKYDIIKKLAFKDSCGALKNFLCMSQFVDGEFAESYFEDATFIIDNNIQKFCDLFTIYGSKELKIFNEEYEDNCK